VSHNERLAFLGDAVLALVVAELVSERAPDAGVGRLTVERARLVSGPSLAGWAVRLGLPARLRLGRGETLGGGAAKESILATAFEAVIGALYLDASLAAVTGLVRRLLDVATWETDEAPRPGSC
jgi:ribonuclease-3